MLSSAAALAHRISHRLERRVDRALLRTKQHLGWQDPVTIQPFRGYGDETRARARGRVLEETGSKRQKAYWGRLGSLVQMYHRFASDELAGARVEARFRGRRLELESDEEGYIEAAFTGIDRRPARALTWQNLTFELIGLYSAHQPRPVRVDVPILTPPADADLALVSDIDDTVLRTGATNLLRNLRTTLFSSVESRQTFPGLATFYRALQRGNRHEVRNPIFYVSSSPWNLHDLLEEFMALNRIPLGPMFLTDLGIDQSKFIRSSHGDHKLAAIETLLEFYPHLRFILIGDSGQHDAEIYRTVVERHPGRVLAVYLRTLSDAPRRDEGAVVPMKIIEQAGVEAVLCPTLVLAAENAAAKGWIPPSVIDEIKADVERSTTETPLG